jgi:hypothetical protein
MPKQLDLMLPLPNPGRPSGSLRQAALAQVFSDITRFTSALGSLRLRSYQQTAAQAIVDSVIHRRGLSFVVLFPRQSGKNELQAHLEAYLLALFARRPLEIVKVSPTWKPQSQNAMRRLERVLEQSQLLGQRWVKEQGYIYRVGLARISFLSAAPTSNVVGATASLLLECDEAQDVSPEKWDKEILPMASSTNATRVYWGTAWTADTLLGRELRAARQAEDLDGRQRLFTVTADQVRQEVPAYGAFVDSEIARLGRTHPFIRTQYFSEELASAGGLFNPERLALMHGSHQPLDSPPISAEGSRRGVYAFLLDIAGEAETPLSTSVASGEGPGVGSTSGVGSRDSTALTIVEVDLSTLADPLIARPRYRLVHRRLWTGICHTSLYAQLTALIDLWQPQRVIIDATGVGAGLASFLSKAHPSLVTPFIFTSKSKSDLGWRFLSVIETGRYLEFTPRPEGGEQEDLQRLFWLQAAACQMEVLPGPAHLLRWSVPDGRRNPLTGALLHDDLLISAALCALLDDQIWGPAQSAIIPGNDPLASLAPVW